MFISGRASRVGGEPGITRAVLTKIQVNVMDMFVCVCACMYVCVFRIYNCILSSGV